MIVEAFVSCLDGRGLGTPGKDIFAHAMPQDAKSAIMIAAPTSGIAVDAELTDFFLDSMVVVIRETSLEAAQRKAKKIMDVMPIMHEEHAGVSFRFIRPMTLPIPYPRNSAALYEVGIPVEFAAHLL